MTVVALHQERPCANVAYALRDIADQIERGEIAWPVTTAVLLLGHTGPERPSDEEGEYKEESHWTTYGFGPRRDIFTCRGLMATCLNRWNHDD
jgi:hypothetical protein